jgi:hypothetical protein
MSIEHIVDVGYVVIEPLRDPLQRPDWLPTASNDLLAFVTPILGPTATLIVHRFGCYFAAGYEWHQFDLGELAATFGVGGQHRNSALLRSLQRIDRFGFGRLEHDTPKFRIRTAIPPLAKSVARVIPAYLADTCPYLVR